MKLTKKQLKVIIENYLFEQAAAPEEEEEEIDPADLEVEAETGDETEPEEGGEDVENEEGGEDVENEEEPEPEFQEFETDEYPVSIGNRKVFAKVIDKGINSVKIYSKENNDRIEGLKDIDISAIMFKTLVKIIQKGGDEEDKKNLVNFFRYSQPQLESMSDEEIEKDLAKRERIWKMSLNKLKDKLNRENYLK